MRRSTPGSSSARSRLASCATGLRGSRLKSRDKLAHLRAHVGTLQRHRQIGDHETGSTAAVVTLAFEPVSVQRLLADQLRDRVGELDLPAGAGLLRVELAHDL